MPARARASVIALLFALVTLIAHLATDGRYGYFRDELYFIACAHHLAWGYVDQPPLVALAAYLASPAHEALIALRALPSIAAAITVYLAVRITEELGGGTFAKVLTGLTVMLLPAYVLLGNTLTTTSFEPLSWTLLLYALLRILRTGDRRYWIAAGAAFAFGMYGKYSIGLLAFALLIGLLLTPARRALRSWWFAGGVLLAAAALLPNAFWQWQHGWPFLTVMTGDVAHRHAFQTGWVLEYRSVGRNALAFGVEQILYTNPIAAACWIAGWCALAFAPMFTRLRAIAIGYAALVLLAILLQAKGYYIIGCYAFLLAAGAVAIERSLRRASVRSALVAAYAALSLAILPLSLPILPVDTLIAYTRALHLTGNGGTPAHLIQPIFAEEFGWRRLVRRVAAAYDALPPKERARTAIFADTYADAGAIDFFGPAYGLPPALSAQNTYFLWGTHHYDGSTLLFVGATQAPVARAFYHSMRMVATSADPYTWIVEGATPIYLCRGPVAPLAQLWPRLRWYGA